MNNSNDNTEIPSSNPPNAGSSNTIESSSRERTTNPSTSTSNETGKKISVSKTLTIERTCENQNNQTINTVNVVEEENIFTNPNAQESSSTEHSSDAGPSGISGTEIIQRVTNFTISPTVDYNAELTNRNESDTNVPNEEVANVRNHNAENNTAENGTPADVSNTTRLRQASEETNTNSSSAQEYFHTINPAIASFPEPQETRSDFITNSSRRNPPTSYQRIVPQTRAQRCYRALTGHVNSNIEVNITPPPTPPRVIHGPPPLLGAPPSYSAVMRLGPREDPPRTQRPPVRIQPSPPFIAPVPPPPYSVVQGQHVERSMLAVSLLPTFSVDQMVWGPDPLSLVCPRCANVVVTSTQSQRSNLTHFSALALFLCGCWPCCLLPYCMDSCKNTSHHCPSCHQFLGMYRPW